MQAAHLKIFDLLAGVSPRPQGPAVDGKAESVESTDNVFAELLMNLGNGIAHAQNPESAEIQNQIIDAAIVLEHTQEQTLVVAELLTNSNDIDSAAILSPEMGKPAKDLQSLVELMNSQIADNSETLKTADITKDLKNQTVPSDRSNNGQQVSINKSSVPVILSGFEPSLELTGSAPDSQAFENNLTKLNVKEVKINLHKDNVKTSDEPLVLNPGANKVKEILIKSNSVQASSNDNNNVTLSIDSINPETAEESDDFINAQPKQNDNEVVSQTKTEKITKEFDSVLNKEQTTVQNKPEQNSMFELKSVQTNAVEQSESKFDSANQQVKIIIPENARLNPNQRHQSIMIKIEPEHLGPAQLDLQLKHDVLNAKLTVDTAEAKAVVDKSIHSLKEQLARLDIKVEQIEVNVRGESNYNQMFEKQPQWHKQSNMNNFRFENEDYNEQLIPVNNVYVPESLHYVNSSGVNVLA